MAHKYYGIGGFYQELNDIFRAELYYQNAINLFQEQKGYKEKEFKVLNDLITMSMEFRDFEKAKKYINEALSVYNNSPSVISPRNLAMVYLNAGNDLSGP